MHALLTMKLRRSQRAAVPARPESLRARHVLGRLVLLDDASGPRLAPVVLCDRDLPDTWSPQAATVVRGVIR